MANIGDYNSCFGFDSQPDNKTNNNNKMQHIGLFEGIGGFSLAARWMGWETIAWCEWNEFGQKVLKHHFPKATPYGDITKTDFTIYNGQCDILTGGFPCQPYSNAGKRLGKEDERHLWPQMLRAIREIEPTFIVGENVRGLLNWNGGMVFDEVCADLENLGYEVTPCLIPAVGVNAPHKRERIWFVAYSPSNGYKNRHTKTIRKERGGQQGRVQQLEGVGSERATTDTDRPGSETRTQREVLGQPNWKKANGHSNVERPNKWQNFPTQSPICSRNDGLSARLDGITFSKWRNESIKAGGNAIVPQVAYQIFKAIELCNSDHIK